jgi:FkbM family methyltransferase
MVSFAAVKIPLRWLANRVPRTATMRILQGPARNLHWLAGAASPGFWVGTYEKEKVREFCKWLKSDSVVYDIGAHAGYYSLVAARRCAAVYAFEPYPQNAFFLREHFRKNKLTNCHAAESAVGNIDGFIAFAPFGLINSQGHIDPDGPLRLRCSKLDTFCETSPAPDIMKIDVEGAELDVLKGGARVISAKRPAIFLATHSSELNASCRAFLLAFGYQIRELDHDDLIAYI